MDDELKSKKIKINSDFNLFNCMTINNKENTVKYNYNHILKQFTILINALE